MTLDGGIIKTQSGRLTETIAEYNKLIGFLMV